MSVQGNTLAPGFFAIPRLDLGQALYDVNPSGIKYIADQVLAPVPVSQNSAKISVITRESLLSKANGVVAPGAGYARIDMATKDVQYACNEIGFESKLPDRQKAIYASFFDAEVATSKTLLNKLLLDRESRVAAKIFDTAKWTGSSLAANAGSGWSTAATGTVLADVANAKLKINQNTGLEPNVIVCSQTVLNYMKANTAILNATQYTRFPNDKEWNTNLAGLFGVDRILVANSVYNSGGEGQAFSSSTTWSSLYCWVGRVALDGESLDTPCVGRSPVFTGDVPDGGPFIVEQYREESARSNVYRIRQTMDELVYNEYLGFLITV